MKETYRLLAQSHGIDWTGCRHGQADPVAADLPSQSLNHASSAVEAATGITVAATGAIPQPGFIHEDPGQSFVLDVADLYRADLTIPCALRAARQVIADPVQKIERVTRRLAAKALSRQNVIPSMIGRITPLVYIACPLRSGRATADESDSGTKSSATNHYCTITCVYRARSWAGPAGRGANR